MFELNRFVTVDKNLSNSIKCKWISIILCALIIFEPFRFQFSFLYILCMQHAVILQHSFGLLPFIVFSLFFKSAYLISYFRISFLLECIRIIYQRYYIFTVSTKMCVVYEHRECKISSSHFV